MIDLLLSEEAGSLVDDILSAEAVGVHVPSLCDIEVASALRRGILAGRISSHRAEAALFDYVDLSITRHDHLALLPRILELRDNFTAHDACYVALAETLGAVLVTTDGRLARGARAHTNVESIP